MKKVLVIAYFAKNFGDDLFLKILFDRYKNIQWVMDVSDLSYRKVFSEYKNVEVINPFRRKIFRNCDKVEFLYNKYDAVVFIGGSIFIETENWKNAYKIRNKIFRTFNNKPIFFIGCNFGPHKSLEFYEGYKRLFSKCRDICFRDDYSYKLFRNLSNARLATDIVFQLRSRKIEKVKKSLGISVIDLSERKELLVYQEKYVNKIVDIINEAVKRKKKITLFSFCEKQGDIKVIGEIISRISNEDRDYISIENYDGNIERFLDKFSSMEDIIATRFHGCILSQVFNQGLYPIIYSDKTYNVLKDIELVDEYVYVQDIEKLDEQHILDIISKNKIKNNKVFFESEKQFEVLDDYIKCE